MTITFTFFAKHQDSELAEDRGPEVASWLLNIDGSKNDLFKAASIVRTHAINTRNPESIRLVRVLKEAATPDQIRTAISAFRKWTAETNGS